MPEQVANVIHEAEFHKLFDPRAIRRTNPVLRQALALHASGSAGTRSGPRRPVPQTDRGDHHDRARTRRD